MGLMVEKSITKIPMDFVTPASKTPENQERSPTNSSFSKPKAQLTDRSVHFASGNLEFLLVFGLVDRADIWLRWLCHSVEPAHPHSVTRKYVFQRAVN